jgi:hypothetical protein
MIGWDLQDPFGEKRGKFDYKSLLKRLQVLKEKYGKAAESDDSELEEAPESDAETNS